MNNAHKTAITRSGPSAPMKRLAADDRITGRSLDYGCGKGFDAAYYDMNSYDPHYQPDMPEGRFDTITCMYVLNVIESSDVRTRVLQDIQSYLSKGGFAYITVRNDRRALKGHTSKGTFQSFIVLRLPVVYRCAGYVTYALRRSDHIDMSIQSEHVV